MSKRVAQTQGGKDIGFGDEMSGNSDDMPKRATAAQLANRKIKQARQRTRVASPNPASSTSQSFSSPFSTIDPNIVPPNSSGTNGFTFGQSQSFPQTGPATGTQNPPSSIFGDQNNSGSKLFGQGGSAPSSFNFSASTSQEMKNPFANMSSGFGQSQGGGFQGFQGNTFNIPGTANQDKAGQQAPTAGIFGSPQPQQQSSFTFGNSTPKTSSPFSPAPPASAPPAPSTSIFGHSTGSNIFGQSSATNPFGATSHVSKPADEMQTSPDSKNGTGQNRANQFFVSGVSQPSFTSPAKSSPFETSAFKAAAPSTPSTSQPFSTSTFNATPSGGSSLFGNLKKPEETPKPDTTGGSLFGNLKKPEETPKPDASATPASTIAQPSPKFSFTPSMVTGSSLFGQTSKPEDKPATTAAAGTASTTTSAPLFSTSFSAPSPAPFSLFGTPSKPKEPSPAPSTAEDRASPSKSPAPSASPAPEPSTSTSTSLFGRIGEPEETSAPSGSASENENASAETPSRSPSLTPSVPSGTSLFGRSSKPAETTQTSSIFSTPAKSTAPSAPLFSFTPPSNNLFQSPAKTDSAAEEKKNETPQTIASIFQAKPAGETTPSSANKPLFGASAQNQQPASSLVASTPTSTMFKTSSAPEQAPSTPPAASTTLTQSFTPTSTPKPLSGGITNGEKTPKEVDTTPAKTPSAKGKESSAARSRLATYGPPEVPSKLNNDERAGYDTQWRTKALNESFKRYVLEIDPEADDLESLIEYYVTLRRNIGDPMRLKFISTSGTKRKAEENEQLAEYFSDKRPKTTPSNARNGTVDGRPSDAASSSSSPRVGGSLFGEKAASASSIFSSAASPLRKRKATDVEDDASPGSEPGKRSKSAGESEPGGSIGVPKSSFGVGSQAESEKDGGEKKDDASPKKNGASDTATMFATSFVSQSQRSNGSSVLTAPFSTGSPAKEGADNTASASASASGSEHESEGGNASAGEAESESSPTPPATSNGGRSLFDRVELDQTGKPLRQESDEDKDKVAESSAEVKEKSVSSLFAGSKFASSFNSPTPSTAQFSTNGFDFKSPRSLSPLNAGFEGSEGKSPPSIFGGSTGTSTPAAPATSSLFPKTGSSIFGNGSNQLSPYPFSAGTSAEVSRSTTPNQSDNGADEAEDATPDAQVDLLRGGQGEENEDEVFEVRAKAFKLQPPPGEEVPKWEVQGVGLLRILKHKTTGRSRVLLRADPSGRVILNSLLVPQIKYTQARTAVQFLVPKDPKPESWSVRVKKETEAADLAAAMEKHKQTES
ncbi:hypothetical protein AJ79_06226 [Helicocarpus griseus UAMH5409]|uniref:RanBD1 domain-containing protein n=1 Tax=Helicocarpus griseus UAMH5409 TaxID=1447875 RepID=A0A2B7XEI4_9EURO|nr:hypothetical protein AJ79_06226 [Helicocarpus griseus UAMH5409]